MKLCDLIQKDEVLYSKNILFDTEIENISSSSDEISRNTVFVCLCGTKTDGHKFIEAAIKNGACVIVAERDTKYTEENQIPIIYTKNTHKLLALMWQRFYKNPASSMKIIGITGTNGKTSTSYMIKAILEKAGKKVGILGTIRYATQKNDYKASLTTPDPKYLAALLYEMKESGVQYVIMEVSSHSLAQYKTAGIDFEVGVFTNLTVDHLDYHGDMESYFIAKSHLFENSKISLFNADDAYSSRMSLFAKNEKYFYSAKQVSADFSAQNIKLISSKGIKYDFLANDELFRINVNIPGKFTVYNSLAAASTALILGIAPYMIQDALNEMSGITGRMERISEKYNIFIDFAHTPDALKQALLTIKEFMQPDAKLYVLFGCGGDRDKSKRKIMGQIASHIADFCIITSDNPRSENPMAIISDILRGIDKEKPHIVIEDRKAAIEYAIRYLDENDVLLLAGKGHEDYVIDKSGKHFFSEREIALRTIEEKEK